MRRPNRSAAAWSFGAAAFLLVLVLGMARLPFCTAFAAEEAAPRGTSGEEGGAPSETGEPGAAAGPRTRRGLAREDGKLLYYLDDGTLFADGYKAVEVNGKRVYYYFQPDGTAFTGGFKTFSQGGRQYYFYFQPDGTAFTGGYKEITVDGRPQIYYFLANGQAYTAGYKTVVKDGETSYYYFGSDGRAVTDVIRSVSLGPRTAYFFFQKDGSAFTGGYRAVPSGSGNDYYYFLRNGQAFTTGYKTVSLDGKTRYFFFQPDGRAYTGGLKSVSFGSLSYYYFFQSSGQALTSGFMAVDGTNYYFTENGRAACDTFAAVDGSPAYFDSSYARAAGGWFRVGDGYYFADEDGVLLTDTVKEGYRLDASGRCATKYRILRYVDEIVSPSMTEQEKIDAIYDWVLGSSLTYLRSYEHIASSWVWKDGWPDDMAASLMDRQGGNCYRYAAFFGFLVHEATGLPVMVYRGMTPGISVDRTYHGWTVVKQDGVWYSYDPELQKFSDFTEELCRKRLCSESYGTLYFDGTGTNLF